MVCDKKLYHQPHDHCVVPAPACGRPPIETPGPEYWVPRLTSWQGIRGFENVSALPLPSTAVTNAHKLPCYTHCAMSTQPLRFPNMVTGFERNPGYAARSALNTRYTAYEWAQNNISHFNESCTVRMFSERQRQDSLRSMREHDERTVLGQTEVGRRLGERLSDLTHWKEAAQAEYDSLICEINCMQDKRRLLEKAIQDLEGPIHIALECLSQRESRIGIDLVHDQAEAALLDEVAALRKNQDNLRCLHSKVARQLCSLRACHLDLERDIRSKEEAILIDCTCHGTNNNSPSLTYLGGIEKFQHMYTNPPTWADKSNDSIKRSQMERGKSQQMRSDADNMINAVAQETWTMWETTNALLSSVTETFDAKKKLAENLHHVQDELFRNEKYMELLRKAIDDKTNPLKVAHTRLEARSHRKNIELCHDDPHQRLIQEVGDLSCSIQGLNRNLMESEASHAQLLKTRCNLECALRAKTNSLYIDREKCLSLRRSFPIYSMIKYC